jgi:hypothetical protein
VPAGLNPTSGQKEPPESLHGEAPSAAAELWVIKVPADDRPDISGDQQAAKAQSGWILTRLRRIGVGVGLRVAVPPGDADELVSMIRCIVVSLVWGATVATTLVIADVARLPAAVVVIVVVLELAGLYTAMRRTRRRDR